MKKIQQQGFTLIELLVVIAVIGILAAVVLIAIDPLEQINRGKDSSIKQNVNTVGNAAQSAYTASASNGGSNPTYPVTGATAPEMQDNIVVAGDLKVAVAGVVYTGCATAPCTSMIAFQKVTSKSSISAAIAAGVPSGATACTVTQTYFAYSATTSGTPKAGYYCGATAPAAGATVY